MQRIPDRQTTIGKGEEKLQVYLHRIGWKTSTFTNARLECMLAASCLRYIGGLEELSFVFGLSRAISTKYQETMPVSLSYKIMMLNNLDEQRQQAEAIDDDKIMKTVVYVAQKLTGIQDLLLLSVH